MNNHLDPILRDALNGSFRRPTRTALVEVISRDTPANDGELSRDDLAAIDAQFAHHITRERSGCGLSDWARMKCSCGFVGPKRFESDDSMMTKLCGDENAHVSDLRVTR